MSKYICTYTSKARASRVAEVSRFKKCSAIGSKNIQKPVLPIGAAADFDHLCRTFELLAQILAPFFHFPFISLFSSQLHSTRVGLLQLSCACPSSYVEASGTSYYKACTKYVPVLLRTTKLEQSTSLYYFGTTKLAQSTSQYYFVLQSLHKVFPSTTSYYKACTKYVPVLLRTTKLEQSTSLYYFGTTKLAQSTSQYYFVLQSLHKVLPTSQYYFVLQSLHKVRPSTTSYYKTCTKYFPALLRYYKACTKYFPVLLRTTKLAQRTSQYYMRTTRLAQRTSQ